MFSFLLNLKVYVFQVHTALCVRHPESGLLPSPFIPRALLQLSPLRKSTLNVKVRSLNSRTAQTHPPLPCPLERAKFLGSKSTEPDGALTGGRGHRLVPEAQEQQIRGDLDLSLSLSRT